MVEFRREQQDALALAAALDRKRHAVLFRDGDEALADGAHRRSLFDRVEHHPHEEAVALGVVELVGIENVATVPEEMGGDSLNDPREVRARQGQDSC